MRRAKVISFHARATRFERIRWHHWSRLAGFSSVGRWLAMLANREVKRQEIEHGARETPPDTSFL
ncbi:MAG: hypothetical protein K0U98_21545 [Deltaproteobacteria bacterium]|nr:hypothetical protein [Deltaproteobacteria bacterium]